MHRHTLQTLNGMQAGQLPVSIHPQKPPRCCQMSQAHIKLHEPAPVSTLAREQEVLKLACAALLCSAPAPEEDPSPAIQPLQAGLSTALSVAQALTARQPPVENAARLVKRIQGDIAFLERCTAAQQLGGAGLPLSKAFTPARVQGLINNLRGYSGELLTAQAVPGLIGMGKRFHIIPCTSAAAPGSAHEPLLEARRQQLLDMKRQQQERSKEHLLSKVQPSNAATSTAHNTVAVEAVQPGQVAVSQPGLVPARSEDIHNSQASNGNTDSIGTDGIGQTHSTEPQVNSQLLHASTPVDNAAGGNAAVGNAAGGNAAGGNAASRPAVATASSDLLTTVEVDLVCQGGSLWLEVKSQERFSVLSEHWSYGSGVNNGRGKSKMGMKGLKRQVEEMLAVAGAPCNAVRWAAPRVGVVFPAGASPDVVAALREMGAIVVEDLDQLEAALPLPPPEPTTTNLDTTTMCALVSEVSWCEPRDARVTAWAARTSHWRECVAAQEQSPLLPTLNPYLAPGRRLIAADVAVEQFQVLIDGFSGPREQDRWRALKQRIEVIPTRGPHASNLSPRLTCLGTLREVGQQQVAVFGVGDTCQALTLTANGAAVRSAARQGVSLEAVVHRPVWLTGL